MMKVFQIKFIGLLMTMFLLTTACEKIDFDNPGIDGDLVKARIDGKEWVAKTQDISGKATTVGYSNNFLSIMAHNTMKGFDTDIQLRVHDVKGPGTYVLNNQSPGRGRWKNGNQILGDNYYFSNEVQSGSVTIISIDTKAKNIKGNFHFSAVNSNGKIVEINDGYFDVKY